MSVVKITHGKSARAMLNYLNQQEKKGLERCTDWASSLPARDEEDIARQWDMTREIYGKPGGMEYYHASLNVDPADPRARTLTDKELLEMGQKFAERFAPGHDWATFVHRDKDHPHVHVIWNTVNYETGKKFHQSKQDLYWAFEIKNQIDEEYQIRQVENSKVSDQIAEKAQRLYERDPGAYIWTEDLKERITMAREESKSFEEFLEALRSQNVDVRVRGKEEKLTYVFEDREGKQRQIREGRLGVDYGRGSIEQEIHSRADARGKRDEGYSRDIEGITGRTEGVGREFADDDVRNGRANELGQSAGQYRGNESGDIAFSKGNGSAERGDENYFERYSERGQSTEGEPRRISIELAPDNSRMEGSSHAISRGWPGSENGGIRDNSNSERKLDESNSKDMACNDNERSSDRAYSRVLDLAAPGLEQRPDNQSHIREANRNREEGRTTDRTVRAVEAQIAAFRCERFEVGIRDANSGKMMMREWSSEEVVNSVSWMKRMNALGNDIYIRPQGSQGVVLVDDLNADSLAQMKRDGYEPALVTETSPKNYQAWIRVSEEPIKQQEATSAAKYLAHAYGGDPNSADWRHFGRLAGFTNRKPQYEVDGQQPYVLLRESSGRVATKGQALMEDISKESIEQERSKRVKEIEKVSTRQEINPGKYDSDPATEYQRIAKPILEKYSNPDWSRVDWMVAKEMAQNGRSKDYIIQAIEDGSPDLADRKAGHVDDYVERTVNKAIENSNRFSLSEDKSQDFGLSR